jgi:hypothetical protein
MEPSVSSTADIEHAGIKCKKPRKNNKVHPLQMNSKLPQNLIVKYQSFFPCRPFLPPVNASEHFVELCQQFEY